MKYRVLGKTGMKISEIGYGMWGMAGWTGTEDKELEKAMDLAVEMGCNFFDTAWGYGAGKSENILAQLRKRHPNKTIYSATKIPPKNFKWPALDSYLLEDCYPYDHIIEYTEKSLVNLGLECIDIQQFHVWSDHWSSQEEWKKAIEDLTRQGKVRHFGISVNRWEPTNCLKALDTGLIDVIQVIYNIFDQAPEDELFPYCLNNNIGIIARVPFDEGSLTGNLTKDTVFPAGDWRSTYFVPENLIPTIERVEQLKKILPEGLSLPSLALQFILHHPAVSTTIPGMRTSPHVQSNLNVSDFPQLSVEILEKLKTYRWDRTPTTWSQ